MESIEISDTQFTSEGESKGPLVPQELFKPKSECGIGEVFMGIGEDGEPCPMIKVNKQYFEDFEKIWYGKL